MTLRIKRQLRLHPVEQFTSPSPDTLSRVERLRADLEARGFDVERAARLSLLASHPTACTAYPNSDGTRRSDLPGGPS